MKPTQAEVFDMTTDNAQAYDSSHDAEDDSAVESLHAEASAASPPEPPMDTRQPYNSGSEPPFAGAAGTHSSGAHPYRRMPEKVPITAALLSVVPGLGNIYNGLYARGLTFFLIEFSLIRIAAGIQEDENLAIVVPSIIFFWLFNLFDAYRQALLINLGGNELVQNEVQRSESGGLLLAGVVITVIGLVGTLDFYVGIDIWRLFDHWPALLLICGVGMVARALFARRA